MVGGLAGHSPKVPQLYQVACVAGHRLRGERTEGYQALRCPECGEGIFVLPRSPLPEPAAPPAARSPRPTLPATPAVRDDEPVALSDPPVLQHVVDDHADGEIEWIEPGPDPGVPEG